MRITKAHKIGDKDHNKNLEEHSKILLISDDLFWTASDGRF